MHILPQGQINDLGGRRHQPLVRGLFLAASVRRSHSKWETALLRQNSAPILRMPPGRCSPSRASWTCCRDLYWIVSGFRCLKSGSPPSLALRDLAKAVCLSVVHIRHLSEKGNERRGFFTDVDFRRLRQNLREDLRDYCEFGYLTGWRKGEIASLRWEDIDGELLELRGEYAKNKEPRSVILSGNLEALIARRRAERKYEAGGHWFLSEYVFHRKGQTNRRFSQIMGNNLRRNRSGPISLCCTRQGGSRSHLPWVQSQVSLHRTPVP